MCNKIKDLIKSHDNGLVILDKIDFLYTMKIICIDNIRIYANNFPSLSNKHRKRVELYTYAIDRLLRKYADLMAVNNASIMKEILN